MLHTELAYIERKSRPGDFLVERREVSSRVINQFFSQISVVLIEIQVRSCSVINFDDVPCLLHVRSCPEPWGDQPYVARFPLV